VNEITKSVDAYVFVAEPDSVAEVVAAAVGSPYSCERVGDFWFYTIAGCQLVTNPSEGGYFCFSLIDCDLWESDVEFARFLASATGRSVRCDPGSAFPEVSPYSDTFLQIENGNESLVDWYADSDE